MTTVRWRDMVFRLYCFSCGATTERPFNQACGCGSSESEEMDGPCWETAYWTGLKRGLELAKEHARMTGCFCIKSIDWAVADEAVAKECDW